MNLSENDISTLVFNFSEYLKTQNCIDNPTANVIDYNPNLDNYKPDQAIAPEEEKNPMAYQRARVLMHVDENGKRTYKQISGRDEDERNDKIVQAYIESGRIFEFLSIPSLASIPQKTKHGFSNYANHWFDVFAEPTIEAATALTYRRQLDLYWISAFGDKSIEDITSADVQEVLNGMGDVSKDTRKKAVQVLSMILDQAIEDGHITRNVTKSKKVKITGRAPKPTEPYSVDQMRYLVTHIPDVTNPTDRAYLAIAALHPLRPEEVFGLKYGDIDRDALKINIVRAVTYPDRNQPLIKSTKTDASERQIDLAASILGHIPQGNPDHFIFGGDKPMTHQQIKRMRDRIQRQTGFDESITPRRFRTTVLTDLYDATKDIKQCQQAAGHTTADMTLKYYVKGRQQTANTATPVSARYGLTG